MNPPYSCSQMALLKIAAYVTNCLIAPNRYNYLHIIQTTNRSEITVLKILIASAVPYQGWDN